ncbi:nucleotide diphosphatase [Sporobolomyces salmoneus]|uniref:nucleotide diphosphatase n=1 Tax=Sporobolomyces salmoneus TaxID=183962 RepID=UPI00316C8E7D
MSNEKAPLVGRVDPVCPHALNLPVFNLLRGKRIVLASASPRRAEILKTYGLQPEIVPSTFPETLSHADFPDLTQYPIATATEKAVEVYEKLVRQDPEDPPDLVIGADTVVLLAGPSPAILEKPQNETDQMDMLRSYRGEQVQVVTGVTIVQPIIANPGYSVSSLVVGTKIRFNNCSDELLQAYVDCGEGLDRAGGFAIQQQGGLLIKSIDGDYNNVVGFPGSAFFEWLSELADQGELLTMD